MKETIYTIPLSEALEEDSECPFCFLENKIEREQVEYALGPAMMEPDQRILSNEKGYCRRHTQQMAAAKKALPFSLVFDTRLDEVIRKLETCKGSPEKGGRFLKKASSADRLAGEMADITASCLVCEKIEHTMEKFYHTFWYLYQREPDFREKILKSKGFCLSHFGALVQSSRKSAGGRREAFCAELLQLELENLKRMKRDIDGFVKQFDYRSDKDSWQVPKDAHLNLSGKLSKYGERR